MIRLRIKYAENARINPIIAATMVPRADSSFALSPLEVIHRIAPIIRKISAIMTPNTRRIVTTLPTMPLLLVRSRLQSGLNSPVGQIFPLEEPLPPPDTGAAKAVTRAKK